MESEDQIIAIAAGGAVFGIVLYGLVREVNTIDERLTALESRVNAEVARRKQMRDLEQTIEEGQ